MSTIISKQMQIGTSGTATDNFTIRQPATPDGTVRIANGNSGTTTDLVTVTSAGNVGIGKTNPQALLDYRETINVISTNTTAVASRTYVFTATLTLTLPSSPTAGDFVMFANRSATATPVIGRNGQNIMGLAEDMTVDNVNYFATLVFADATRGWIFQ
jgi:hypothetical protein